MANRGAPNLNPYETQTLKNLKKAMAMGMDPSMAGQEISSVLQGAQARVQQRQAQLAPLTDALLQQAQAGAPIGAASALTNAYSTMHPGVQGPAIQSKLGAFTNALYPQGGTSPLYASTATTPTSLDPTDLAAVDAQLQPMIGAQNPATGFPYGLPEATTEIVGKFRTLGYPEAIIEQVKTYIANRWAQMGGNQG